MKLTTLRWGFLKSGEPRVMANKKKSSGHRSTISRSDLEKVRWLVDHREEYSEKLLANIKQRLPELEELLRRADDHWGLEDGVYRFYHQSFKVYGLQGLTGSIRTALASLLPDRPLNAWFSQIVAEGTGKTFEASHNQDWLRHTRPIVEAFFHAHYFLRMACKYGRELQEPPQAMPSGWAALLYLFDLR
jgi:hypothetical protein